MIRTTMSNDFKWNLFLYFIHFIYVQLNYVAKQFIVNMTQLTKKLRQTDLTRTVLIQIVCLKSTVAFSLMPKYQGSDLIRN